MKRLSYSFLLLFGLVLTAFAQKRIINSDWEFQRLPKVAQKGEIKNQGTDWSSQYNVEHVSLSADVLKIAEDTLRVELNTLNNGKWTSINLPHTAFIEDLTVLHQWQGICYYKKRLKLTPEEAKSQLWIEFEGAMHLADVWVNGKHVMQHAGGYTPFVADVTGMLQANAENEIWVRLDNRDHPLIPPGKPLKSLDFCYYGGIYRDINLIVKPSVFITHPILANRKAGGGVFVTFPKVSDEEAEIQIQTEIGSKEHTNTEIDIRQTLHAWSRKTGKGKKLKTCSLKAPLIAGATRTVFQTMTLSNPKLWCPDEPNLYLLSSEVIINGQVVDREETRIGIRRLEITREKGFLINGKPVRLVGSNRHMEYPYVGNALPDNAQFRDIYQIRNNGFNTVRLGHYPQDPSVLDACDELGLLVIEPIPGWQFFNKNPLFAALTYRDIRDMIRRDRNHPSIILWETTLNESWPPEAWKNEAVKVAHEEYPGDQCFTSGDAYGYQGFDVSYNDWEEGFNRPNKTANPGFIREYYDYEFGGHYSTTRIRRGDGEKAQIQNAWNAQWSHNRYRAYYPHTIGDAVWSMYDYNRGCCDNICYSGVADLFRLPKFSLSFFRSQLSAGTNLPEGKMPHELFVASYRWKDLSDTVMVYGNVEKVELRLNGKTVAERLPDSNPDTEYVPKPDGGNCWQLTHPPFTFTGIPPKEGELKAIGYVKGKRVAMHTIHTPQEPAGIEVSYFESGRSASTDDLLIVHVRLLDRHKTLCPQNRIPVTLTVEGGSIIGPSVYQTENGIASFLVQTRRERQITLNAECEGLQHKKTIKLRTNK